MEMKAEWTHEATKIQKKERSSLGRPCIMMAALAMGLTTHAASLTFRPSDDCYAKLAAPDAITGTHAKLELRSTANTRYSRVPYLKFNVSGITDPVVSAKLRLYSTTLNAPVKAYAVSDNSWKESTLTWNNRPATGALIGEGSGTADAWFEIDISGYVTGDGTYSIALDETLNKLGILSSKEGGLPAELVVETDEGVVIVEAAATTGSSYGGTLADDIVGGGSNPTFEVLAGPAWLSIASDGTLSGTPTQTDAGLNSWTILVNTSDSITLRIPVGYAALSDEEVTQIENALGVVLTASEKASLESVVKPSTVESWQSDAFTRINQSRRAYLDMQVVDDQGNPLDGAQVSVKLRNHAFKWGATLNVKDPLGANASSRISAATYTSRVKSLFNSVGLNNGFKQRLSGLHPYLPDFMTWAGENELPVRGHLLIWPGNETKNHLTDTVLSRVEAIENAVLQGASQAEVDTLRDLLKATIKAEMEDWTSRWNVYEWDVINEPLSNHRVQDALGDYSQMAEWFKIAENSTVNPDCKLLINEFQIISAMSAEQKPGLYSGRRDRYMTEINRIINGGGRLDRIGFQSRIKSEHRTPAILWDRLKEFGNAYGLEMAATEFEVQDTTSAETSKPYLYTDLERAQITAEMMTQYFSHPLVSGFTAWNIMHDGTASLLDYDGQPKLNGLVWYYLHHIRYTTDEIVTSGSNGWTPAVFGFKGNYELIVNYNGMDYPAEVTLDGDKAVQVVLSGLGNSAPVWSKTPYNSKDALEDSAYSRWINWLASDLDGDALTFAKVSGPSWVSLTPKGQITGTPAQGDVGMNVLYVSVTDGVSLPVENTVYIPVLNVNDLPLFTADPFATDQAITAEPYTASIAGFASDEDGDTLTFSKVSGPEWLTIAPNGALSGTPTAGNAGINSWTVQADDGQGGISQATLQIAVEATLNLPPVWKKNPFYLSPATEDSLSKGWINWRASDPDGDVRTFSKVSGPAWLSISSKGQFSGTPAQENVGINEFVIAVSDGHNPQVKAVMKVKVLNVNDAPVFANDPILGADAEEEAAYSASIAGIASDEDGDLLVYSKVSGSAWLSIAPDGTLSGTPLLSDVGQNSFTVQVDDGLGGTATATLGINVNPRPNSAPAWDKDLFYLSAAKEDSLFKGWINWRASDPDGDVLSFAKVSGPEWLSISSKGQLAGTPKQSNVGPNAFVVSVTDGIHPPVEASMNIKVLNVNDAPVFAIDPIPGTDAFEDSEYADSLAGMANDEDGDNLVYSKASGPAWLNIATDGTLSGSPVQADVGQNVFTVQVDDGNGASDTATLEITVINVNDAPVFSVDSITAPATAEDAVFSGSVAGNATDEDGDNLVYAKISGPAWLNVAADGSFSGIPLQANVGENTFTIQVSDGNGGSDTLVLNVPVYNVNDAPAFSSEPFSIANATKTKHYAGSIAGHATDEDGDALSFSLLSGPDWMSLAADGSVSGMPKGHDVGENVFTVLVEDGNGASTTGTLVITVDRNAPPPHPLGKDHGKGLYK
jgi:GH35 family endo-1,4-beta-xylanase